MSCLIWLPLNGSLDNHGFGDCSPSTQTNASAFETGGKINESLKLSSTTLEIPLSINSESGFSLALWFKPNSPIQWSDVFSLKPTNERLEITSTSTYNHTWYSDSSGMISSGTSIGNFADSAWHHFAMTCDGAVSKIYIDGTLSITVSVQANYEITHLVLGSRMAGNMTYSGNLNDVRVYDCTLSAKEVKEISKGLILHYPMNEIDGYIGGRNILSASNVYTENSPYSLTPTSNDSYVYFSSMAATVTPGQIYSYQCETDGIWSTHGTVGDKYCTLWLRYYTSDGAVLGHTYFGDSTRSSTGRRTWTWTCPDNAVKVDVRVNAYGAGNSAVKFWNFKLEEGSVATPFTESPEDNSIFDFDTTVFDGSGFTNNGVRALATTPTWSNEAKIGSGSYEFAGGKYIVSEKSLHLKDSTYSIWINFNSLTAGFIIDARTSDVGYQPMYFNGSGIQMYSSSGADSTYINYGFIVGQWYHLVVVMNGTGSTLYINGVFQGATNSKADINNNSKIYIGIRHSMASNTIDAKMSDCRVYATALSAADIAKMYSTRLSLADNGVLFCSSYLDDNSNKFSETGLVKFSNASEVPNIYDMEVEALDDGSIWARIFYHNCVSGTVLFSNEAEALDTSSTYKYSRLKYLSDSFKNSNGKFEFMLTYPSNSTGYNRWQQTNNPCTETETNGDGTATAAGYEAVHIDWTANYWGGLTKSSTTSTFLDGSTGHSNWFYAIGAYTDWNNGIPGSSNISSTGISEVELWVRIDNLNNDKMKIYNGNIVLNEIIEN